ncbi:hypothetical protein LVD15_01945 [Fulvivirga maritima]|uniref:hypothetical protein n=1 Tax=Fulvivirga maritima TaxID=2904247 RepID=UPI001F1DA4D0|nr:hypothetical protein [Fulvivirga maritima]UII27212.1 hypothetical protein LVD15_01945 [Fulvivirga maritima]
MKTDVSASLEFGLRFTEHVGIAAKGYLIIAEQKESNYYSEAGSWEFQGLLAGPLISFALNDNIEWDLRPMIGFCTMADAAYSPIEIEDVASLALNLGTSFRFNIGGRVAIPINIDYFSTEIAATTLGYNRLEMNANYLNITTGIYIRFKG